MANVQQTRITDGPDPLRQRSYSASQRPKIRRVLLACFLCGITASIAVALIAALLAFGFSSITALMGMPASQFAQGEGFMTGAFMAVMISAFNWYFFFIVIPLAWLVLALSIGLFPRRGIMKRMPYYRWGAIWGATLVAGPSLFFGLAVQNGAWTGALVTGALIGATAGVVCAALFLAIVRPRQQIAAIATDVF